MPDNMTLSDLMQFPVAVPNDGMVDIVIQGRVSSCLFFGSNIC